MKAIILCAGYGTRLRPLTDRIPKPLISIAGVTLLDDILGHLSTQGITSVVINGSYRSETLRRHIDSLEIPMEIHFQDEPEPLGTAGAVRKALPLLGDEFCVIYGDNITRQPLSPLLSLHRESGAEVTIALSPTGHPERKGLVITNPSGIIKAFDEKPPPELCRTNLANSGIYACRSSAVENLKVDMPADFGLDVFPGLLAENRIMAAEVIVGYTRDCGTLEDYLLACHDMLDGTITPTISPPFDSCVFLQGKPLPQDTEVEGTLWTEQNTSIEPGTSLENCVILKGAEIGIGSRLKNTLVLPGTRVPERTILDDKYIKILGLEV